MWIRKPRRSLIDSVKSFSKCEICARHGYRRSKFRSLIFIQDKAHANILLVRRGIQKPFEIDLHISLIIDQLYAFTIRDKVAFEGDINKGIALLGYFGCGKTLLMEAWSELIQYRVSELNLRVIPYSFLSSSQLFHKVKAEGVGPYSKCPMIIDELGREAKIAKTWGNEEAPISDLLLERYRTGAITHITANFREKELGSDELYGTMLGDRFKEMFNFIEMKGGSRR